MVCLHRLRTAKWSCTAQVRGVTEGGTIAGGDAINYRRLGRRRRVKGQLQGWAVGAGTGGRGGRGGHVV